MRSGGVTWSRKIGAAEPPEDGLLGPIRKRGRAARGSTLAAFCRRRVEGGSQLRLRGAEAMWGVHGQWLGSHLVWFGGCFGHGLYHGGVRQGSMGSAMCYCFMLCLNMFHRQKVGLIAVCLEAGQCASGYFVAACRRCRCCFLGAPRLAPLSRQTPFVSVCGAHGRQAQASIVDAEVLLLAVNRAGPRGLQWGAALCFEVSGGGASCAPQAGPTAPEVR